MFLINTQSNEPIYEQIKRQIVRFIEAGVLQPDEKLISVRSLAQQLNINPNTVQKAYQELEAEGILYTLPKKGVFVRGLPASASVNGVETEVRQLLQLCRKLKISTEELIEMIRKEGENDVDR